MIIAVIIIYLVLGAILLALYEHYTRGITRNMKPTVTDAQLKLFTMNKQLVGDKTALVLILITAWLFYPFVLGRYAVELVRSSK